MGMTEAAMTIWHPIDTLLEGKNVVLWQPARELFEGYLIGPFKAMGRRDGSYWRPCCVDGYEYEFEIDNPTLWCEAPEDPS